MAFRVAQKENYREHQLSLRELGVGNEGDTHRVTSLGIRIGGHRAQENHAACERGGQGSTWLPGRALIYWFGRNIQRD